LIDIFAIGAKICFLNKGYVIHLLARKYMPEQFITDDAVFVFMIRMKIW